MSEDGGRGKNRRTRDDRCAWMRDDEEPDVGSRKGQEIRGKRAEKEIGELEDRGTRDDGDEENRMWKSERARTEGRGERRSEVRDGSQISGDRGRKGKADGRGMMDEEDQEVGCQRPEVGEKTEGRGTIAALG